MCGGGQEARGPRQKERKRRAGRGKHVGLTVDKSEGSRGRGGHCHTIEGVGKGLYDVVEPQHPHFGPRIIHGLGGKEHAIGGQVALCAKDRPLIGPRHQIRGGVECYIVVHLKAAGAHGCRVAARWALGLGAVSVASRMPVVQAIIQVQLAVMSVEDGARSVAPRNDIRNGNLRSLRRTKQSESAHHQQGRHEAMRRTPALRRNCPPPPAPPRRGASFSVGNIPRHGGPDGR